MLPAQDVILKPVGNREAQALLEVYCQCEEFLALGPQPVASLEMVLNDIRHSQEQGGRFCGIYTNSRSELLGVIDWIPSGYEGKASKGFITLLVISKPHRLCGVGQRVVEAVEADIWKNANVRVIGTAVQVNNPGAIRFWERLGYRMVGGPLVQLDMTQVLLFEKERELESMDEMGPFPNT